MTIQLRRSRSPFEIGVLASLFLLSLAAAMFFEHLATSTARDLGPALGRAMYVGTALAACVSLVGVAIDDLPGVLVERIGLVSLGLWTAAYGGAVVINSGSHGMQFGGYMLAITIMSFVRAWQIRKEARELATARHLSTAGGSSKGDHV